MGTFGISGERFLPQTPSGLIAPDLTCGSTSIRGTNIDWTSPPRGATVDVSLTAVLAG